MISGFLSNNAGAIGGYAGNMVTSQLQAKSTSPAGVAEAKSTSGGGLSGITELPDNLVNTTAFKERGGFSDVPLIGGFLQDAAHEYSRFVSPLANLFGRTGGGILGGLLGGPAGIKVGASLGGAWSDILNSF